MTKFEYLAELERLLADLPAQERRDAMNYYEEYFVSAGPDKEEDVIRELGTPQQVAHKILEEAGVAAAPAPESAAVPAKSGLPKAAVTAIAVAGALIVVALLGSLMAGALFGGAAPAAGSGSQPSAAQTEPTAAPAASAQTAAPGAAQGDAAGETPASSTPSAGSAPSASSAPAAAQAPASGAAVTGDGANWQAALGSGLYKIDLDLNGGDLQIVLDPNAAETTLAVQGLEQSQFQSRKEDYGERKVTLGGRARGQQAQTFTATLTVPDDGVLQELDLTLNAGSIALPDLTLDELEVELNAGEVTAGSVSAHSVSVETNAGSFTAAALDAGEITLETNAGSIEAARVQPGRELELEANAGSITVALAGTSADYTLEAEGRAGTLTYDGAAYSGLTNDLRLGSGPVRIEAECATGQITVSFLG